MEKPRLCVIGSGFGAFSLITSLRPKLYQTTVVSPRNHFVFTPLLPSTTVGTIEFRSIIEPIRSAKRGIEYLEASCTGIDAERGAVTCRNNQGDREYKLPFDICVIAAGAVSNTFGIPGVAEHAIFLREVSDARAIRQRILECLERAATPSMTDDERRELLRFIVVGGGPTGVEFAAELHDFLAAELREAFSKLLPFISVVLIEASAHLLSTFDSTLSSYTMAHFLRQEIDVRTKTSVKKVEPGSVLLSDGETLRYGLLVWSTGIGASPLIQSLPFRKSGRSRLIVDEYLRLSGTKNLYAIGDCATIEGKELPATGQVAQQEGTYLAKALTRLARGKEVRPFRYRNLGMLAYIGSNEAIADLETAKRHGFATWLFWRSVYLTRLVSLKNKILVLFDWCKTSLFGRDISRF